VVNAAGAWTFTPSGLADGTHTLVATDTGVFGASGTATLAFTLDTTPPAVSETLATDTSHGKGLTTNDTLTGTAEAGGVVTISQVSNNGTSTIGSTTAGSDGSWTFTPSLAPGSYTLVAGESDATGNSGTSAPLAFTYETAPALSLALAADTGSSSSDAITSNDARAGTAAAGGVVTVSEVTATGTTTLGSATADSAGHWSFTPNGLADGTYSLLATTTDAAGASGTAELTFTLDATPPAGFSFTPDTAALGSLSLAGGAPPAVLPMGTLAVTSPVSGDAYAFANVNGVGAITFAGTSPTTATLSLLSPAANFLPGASGQEVVPAAVRITDLTSGVASAVLPLAGVADVNAGDTCNLAALLATAGLGTATPTVAYGLGAAETIDASGLTGPAWLLRAGSGDTFIAGTGADTFLFAAAAESPPAAMDVIGNFGSADVLYFSGLGASLSNAGSLVAGGTLAAGSVAWQQSGGNTFVYVNTSGTAEAVGSTDMAIELKGTVALGGANFVLSH
jgi:hypothetical protein